MQTQALIYDGAIVALVTLIPSGGAYRHHSLTGDDLCGFISPDEGCATLINVSDDEARQIRAGELPLRVCDAIDEC